jgi:ABC-type Na+ efflux pump permease subunit
LVQAAILGKQSGAIMKRKPKKTVKHQTAKIVGVAWMGLALMIMVSIVGAVYWLNPKDNAVRNDGMPAAQSAKKLSPTRATTGSGKFD